MKGFIETFDRSDRKHIINISQIAEIKDIDKYTREIRLSVNDENGKPIIIQSGHSYEELTDLIKQAQE